MSKESGILHVHVCYLHVMRAWHRVETQYAIYTLVQHVSARRGNTNTLNITVPREINIISDCRLDFFLDFRCTCHVGCHDYSLTMDCLWIYNSTKILLFKTHLFILLTPIRVPILICSPRLSLFTLHAQ